MKRFIQKYVTLALIGVLAFTGQSMAVARGLPGPAGQIVLCTGHGPVMVYVDENGAPTGPPVLCPDGALSLIQTTLDAPPAGNAPRVQGVLLHGLTAPQRQALSSPSPQARGPPGRSA